MNDKLSRLLPADEDRLINLIVRFAKDHGYTKYTSTLEEAWRISIQGLTKVIVDALDQPADSLLLKADQDYTQSPATQFGIQEGRLHRERGIRLETFLGLFKYYRKAYLEAPLNGELTAEERTHYREHVHHCFDQMEVGLCSEWADKGHDARLSELQSANRAVVREKTKYLTVFESLSAPAFILDREDRIEGMNHAACLLMGKSGSPGMDYYSDKRRVVRGAGSNMEDIAGAAPQPRLQESCSWLAFALGSFHDNGRLSEIYEVKHHDTYYKAYFSPMNDISDKFSGIAIILNDITESKIALDTIERNARRNRYILKHNPSALAILDKDLRFMGLSDRYKELAGIQENPVGKSIYDMILNISHSRREAYMRCLAGSPHKCDEERVIGSNGDETYEKWECRPWLDDDGNVGGIILYEEDITHAKNIENALRDSESRFRRIYEHAPVMIHSLDTQGVLRNVNSYWLQEMGYTRDEVIGRPLSEFMVEESVARFPGNLKKLVAEGRLVDVEYQYKKKDGSIIDVFLDATMIDDPVGGRRTLSVVRNVTEQKAAHEALRRSEEKSRLLADHTPMGILLVDKEGAVTELNKTLLAMLGSVSASATKAVNVLKTPNLVESGISDLFSRCMCEERVIEAERPYTSLWGKSLYIKALITPLRDKNGEVYGCHAVLGDITERRKAEIKLARELALNAAIADLYVPLVSPASTIEGMTKLVLDKALKLTQSSSGYISRIDPSWISVILASTMPYAREGYPAPYTFRSPDDPLDLSGRGAQVRRPLFGDEGSYFLVTPVYLNEELLGEIVVADSSRDYEKADMEALERLAEYYALFIEKKRWEATQLRLTTAMEQVGEAIVITDSAGAIQYVNPAFTKITGYQPEEVINKDLTFVHGGKNIDEFYEDIRRSIALGTNWSGRSLSRRKDGSQYYEDQKITPLRDASGKIINYVAMKRDVTQQIVLEEQLIQSQKMDALGTLVGGIAHDFNNILQAILGYADLLLMDMTEESPGHEEIEIIARSAKSGAELVQRLLTFGRKSDTKMAPLDMNHEIKQLRTLLSRTIPKMVEIYTEPGPDLKLVNGDALQIERVLMNLAVNANNAMPNCGSITISTKNVTFTDTNHPIFPDMASGEYVLVSVADTGHGMSKNVVDRIFDPFFTTKSMGTTKGTGLGLSIVYGIVKQHKGFIYCESEPSRGSVFNIYLPSVSSPVDAAEEAASAGDMPTGTETILLVDDEESARQAGSRMLQIAGYTVLTANNGQEAVDIYSTSGKDIDLVILDLIMPIMGGEQCYRALRKIRSDVKVMVTTGYSPEAVQMDFAGERSAVFIRKPYEMKELLTGVRASLDREEREL